MLVVHAADLHLDSPLSGLAQYDGAPLDEVRGATRRALEALVDLCLEEKASLLLLAGDLYDGDWRDYSTGLFFLEQMGRLAGTTEVVWIRGNHDAASKITRYLEPPSHVRELSTKAPETLQFEPLGVAVHGAGYASRDVTENLARAYPPPVPGLLNFGLLHTAVEGRPGHANYAPCKLSDLTVHGYDYWALGHVHEREILCQSPWVVFPGNLQGRHIREAGPKGATLITIAGGRIERVEHRALDVVRWAVTQVDVSDLSSYSELPQAVLRALRDAAERADGRTLATRVEFVGRSCLFAELVADPARLLSQVRLEAHGVSGIYIEAVQVRAQPAQDLALLRRRKDALGELFAQLRLRIEHELATIPVGDSTREPASSGELVALAREVQNGLGTIPADLLRELLSDWEGVLGDAEALLLSRLLDAGEAP